MYAQACFISFALTTALLSLCCSCLAASNCASPISCSPPPPPPKIHFQLVSAPSNQKQLEIFLLIFILQGVDIGFILLSVQVLLSSRTVPDITVERVFLEGHCKQGEPDGSTRPACFFFLFFLFLHLRRDVARESGFRQCGAGSKEGQSPGGFFLKK